MKPDSVSILWYHLYIGLIDRPLFYDTVESVKSYLEDKKGEFQIDAINISYFFDHIHLVFALPPRHSPDKAANELMQAISWFLTVYNSANINYITDYALITISPDQIEKTIDYIDNHIDYHLIRKTDNLLEKSNRGWASWQKRNGLV